MSSRVFEFSDEGRDQKDTAADEPAVTCQLFDSDSGSADPEHPIMLLRDSARTMVHHTSGIFINPKGRMAFCFGKSSDQLFADILRLDSRFEDLIKWLGENKSQVRLSGAQTEEGYAVYRMHAVDATGRHRLSSEDAFLQLAIGRLLAADPPCKARPDMDDEISEEPRLTDLTTIENYLRVAGNALPVNIRGWAWRNLSMTRSHAISQEERRHAQRALSIMLGISWESDYFPPIDPVRARAILDENLYGMERVKQRIIETVIQINRTHTLPAYGLLLAGPAGVGKSQIAYAVARILALPWTSLDMSTISDPEALTGSPRVYANAKPGRIMEAFSQAQASNLVFIINELDKAEAGGGSNPADALLTLLDNLGFTDNYMECTIPTTGVYPIATANDKSRISEPLMTRFALIDIPDYTPEEKKIIFRDFSLPKVLRRMAMTEDELTISDEGVDRIIAAYANAPGVRDLEQAAEHLAANALYRIETKGDKSVCFDAKDIASLLGD